MPESDTCRRWGCRFRFRSPKTERPRAIEMAEVRSTTMFVVVVVVVACGVVGAWQYLGG